MLTTPIRAVANVLKAPLYPVYALARRRTPQVGWLHLELRPRLTEFQSALPSLARFVPELAQRNPKNLHEAMAKANAERKLVRLLPSDKLVGRWVEHARTLPRVVTH